MFLSSSSPSNENMNLINLLPLTKRQCIQYLPQETLEAHQQHEELAKEMGVLAVVEEIYVSSVQTLEYSIFLKICYKSST